MPQQAVPGLSLVPASCCSFQAWCRRQVASCSTVESSAVHCSSCCSFQACGRAGSALLRSWQTISRVGQQGCMCKLCSSERCCQWWPADVAPDVSVRSQTQMLASLAARCVHDDMLHTSHVCMVLQLQGALVHLQQQAAALQSQQQRGFTASARDVAGLQAQLSAVAQRQQQQLYTDEATTAATATAAARTASSSSMDSRSGAGAAGTRKDELQRQVTHGPLCICCCMGQSGFGSLPRTAASQK